MSNRYQQPAYMEDYNTVADRLRMAKDAIQEVIVSEPRLLNGVLGMIQVTVILKDGRRASGTASFRTDSEKGAQKNAPLEDAETSALGRALAFLGYSTSKSIASQDEIEVAKRREAQPTVASREKIERAIATMMDTLDAAGLEYERPVSDLTTISYDALVDLGRRYKALLTGANE
jgi:hypothetical protein